MPAVDRELRRGASGDFGGKNGSRADEGERWLPVAPGRPRFSRKPGSSSSARAPTNRPSCSRGPFRESPGCSDSWSASWWNSTLSNPSTHCLSCANAIAVRSNDMAQMRFMSSKLYLARSSAKGPAALGTHRPDCWCERLTRRAHVRASSILKACSIYGDKLRYF